MEVGNQSKSDNEFTKKCRLHQSLFRKNVLKEDYGFGPCANSKKKYGNMLIDGEITGSNFISKTAFEFAKQKCFEKQINKYLTIDEYRLFNNMLSSMPMCFNFFSDLRKLLLTDQNELSRIIRLMFKEITWIRNTTFIDVEFIPIPISDYTNDKSAFDAVVLVEDSEGKKGLISVETKYTDLLGSNTAKNSELKNLFLKKENNYDKELTQELKKNGYKQIHRNHILTLAFAKKNKISKFVNIIISPKEDEISKKEIVELKKHMTKYSESILKISVEDFVERGIKCKNKNISSIMKKNHKRYLEFDKLYY